VQNARYKMEKREFVNAIKRYIGRCANPACPRDGLAEGQCTAGFEACFDFDHRVPADKGRAITDIVIDCRSLPTAKKELRVELPKTRLLCGNCHHEVTRKGLTVPEADECAARPEAAMAALEGVSE